MPVSAHGPAKAHKIFNILFIFEYYHKNAPVAAPRATCRRRSLLLPLILFIESFMII